MAKINWYIPWSKMENISLKKLDDIFDITYQFEINYYLWLAIWNDMYINNDFLDFCIENNIKNKEAVKEYKEREIKH